MSSTSIQSTDLVLATRAKQLAGEMIAEVMLPYITSKFAVASGGPMPGELEIGSARSRFLLGAWRSADALIDSAMQRQIAARGSASWLSTGCHTSFGSTNSNFGSDWNVRFAKRSHGDLIEAWVSDLESTANAFGWDRTRKEIDFGPMKQTIEHIEAKGIRAFRCRTLEPELEALFGVNVWSQGLDSLDSKTYPPEKKFNLISARHQQPGFTSGIAGRASDIASRLTDGGEALFFEDAGDDIKGVRVLSDGSIEPIFVFGPAKSPEESFAEFDVAAVVACNAAAVNWMKMNSTLPAGFRAKINDSTVVVDVTENDVPAADPGARERTFPNISSLDET